MAQTSASMPACSMTFCGLFQVVGLEQIIWHMDVVKVCHVKRIYFNGILVQANVWRYFDFPNFTR